LEVGVAFFGIAAAAVEVDAAAIDLPDFDDGIADGVAFGVEEAAAEVGDFADSGGEVVVEDEKVVIGIEREFVRIEGAFGLTGRLGEGFGESAGRGEGGGEGDDGFAAGPDLWEGEGFRFHGVSKAGGGGVGNSADLGEVGSWMMVVV